MNASHFGMRAWRLGGVGAAALAALAALVVSGSRAGDKNLEEETVQVSAELAWVPPGAAFFATVRPAALWQSTEGKILREHFPDLANRIESDVERAIGLKPAELESVTIVMAEWSLGGRGGARPQDMKKVPADIPKVEFPKEGETSVILPVPSADQVPQPPDQAYDPPVLLIATASDPAALARLLKTTTESAAATTYKGKTIYQLPQEGESIHFVNDRTVARGSVKQIQRGLDRTGTETKGALAPGLRLAKDKHHLAAGLQLTEKDAAELLDAMNGMGREYRGLKRALQPLFRARAAAAYADIGKETRAEVQLYYRDGTQAKAALPAALDALDLLRILGLNEALAQLEDQLEGAEDGRKELEAMFGIQILEQVESGLRRAKGEVLNHMLRLDALALTDLTGLAAQTKDVLKTRSTDESFAASKNRKKSQSNLRQIGMALAAIETKHKRLPPADMCDMLGLPLLSWRVAILPFIGEQELFSQFKLDEPWNSKHNLKLLAKMPKIYAPPGVTTKEAGWTYYQGFVADPLLGPEHATAWESTPDAASPFGAWGPPLVSFTDGTSNTISVVEGGQAVPWTKPVDLQYDPAKDLPKLGGLFPDGFHALFADGSPRFIPQDFDAKMLRLLITRADGQPVSPPPYRVR